MPIGTTIEKWHAGIGKAPVADVFNGNPATDVFSMENYGLCTFYVFWGVGTTGTATITVEACDDFTPSTTSAVAFDYAIISSPDTNGALTTATSAGFTTTAGSNQIYMIQVEGAALGSSGPNVRLKMTEVANAPVLGGVMVVLSQARYAEDQPPVATS